MLLIGQVVAAIAALIHVWIFVLESLRFERPEVWRRFGLTSQEQASVVRAFAFNQGFYNLFLAIGVGIGLKLMLLDGSGDLFQAGRAIAMFACGSMAGAGLVLISTNRSFARAAAIQIVPGAAAVVLLLLS
jgi:putative membrane protein